MVMVLRNFPKIKNPFTGARAIQPSTSASADCCKDNIVFLLSKKTILLLNKIAQQNRTIGDGFYKLTERLGYGNWRTLKNNLFEFEQIAECVKRWSDDSYYR